MSQTMRKNLDVWYRITKDLKIEELEKPDLSLSKTTKYWIKGVLSGRTNTTSANNTFEHYDYEIYNEYLEVGQISEMHLTCEALYDTYENMTSGVTTEFLIYDYYKNKSVISQHNNSRQENILKMIIFMKEFGTFKAWEAIELYKDNIRLNQVIIELEKRIKELTDK